MHRECAPTRGRGKQAARCTLRVSTAVRWCRVREYVHFTALGGSGSPGAVAADRRPSTAEASSMPFSAKLSRTSSVSMSRSSSSASSSASAGRSSSLKEGHRPHSIQWSMHTAQHVHRSKGAARNNASLTWTGTTTIWHQALRAAEHTAAVSSVAPCDGIAPRSALVRHASSGRDLCESNAW